MMNIRLGAVAGVLVAVACAAEPRLERVAPSDQIVVRGQILDAATSDPICLAVVSQLGERRKTLDVSAAEGRFAFTLASDSTRVVEFLMVEYAPDTLVIPAVPGEYETTVRLRNASPDSVWRNWRRDRIRQDCARDQAP